MCSRKQDLDFVASLYTSMLDSPYRGEKKSLAINLVVRPAIWGESGVSMMTSMPDPPYKISRNFKLQSCGPNLSWGAIKFVRLDKTITQSTLNEPAEHRLIAFARGGQPSQTKQGTDRFAPVRGNKTWTFSLCPRPRCY